VEYNNNTNDTVQLSTSRIVLFWYRGITDIYGRGSSIWQIGLGWIVKMTQPHLWAQQN